MSVCSIAGVCLAISGCSAAEDAMEPSEDRTSAGQELSSECTTAARDTFVSVTPDCQGCSPGEGRYVVSSNLPGGVVYANTAPCKPNYILDVGGSQRTFAFRAIWEDKVPTQADVPVGGTLASVCNALTLKVSGAYRGNDLPLRTAHGTVSGTKCNPPRIDFNFTHDIVSGLPGEFFAHARFLISGETAVTKGKKFAVQLCRGASSCG